MKKLLILISVFISTLTFAQVPQPLPNTYVNDFAHVLTADQVTTLNQNIAQIEKASTVQFAVVLIDKLPANYTIEDYALLLARKWHVGTNKNGLVYIASIQDHKQRIEKATGLDSVFTESKNQEIMDAIKPSFRGKEYFGGLQILVGQVSTVLNVGAATQTQQPQQLQSAQQGNLIVDQNNDNGFTIFFFIGIAFIVIVVILIIRAIFRNNNRNRQPYNNPNMGPDYTPVNGPGSGGGGFFMGAILGALGALTADRIINNDNNQQDYGNDNVDNNGNDNSSNNDDNSSSWGDWGGGDSSSDSGFSSSDSDSGSSSDW